MPLGIHNPLPSSLVAECKKCGRILASFIDPRQAFGPDKVIPPAVLANAKGLAIITVLKAGFLGSGRYGNGIVVARLADGTWSAPSAIGLGGAGFGGQIGFELTDFVFVLNDAAAVRAFSQQGSLTLGGNVSLAAGPIGRNAEAAGAASLKGMAGVFSYSKTKGLFAGASLEGSAIVERRDANEKLYGQRYTTSQLMEGSVRPPLAVASLMNVLNSRVFAGVAGGGDAMYNDVPEYDDQHDDVVWEGRRGSGYGEGVRRSRGDSYARANDDNHQPKRANTWVDEIHDRPPQSGVGHGNSFRNSNRTSGFDDDYKYSDSPTNGKAGPGRPAAPKPQFTASKTGSLKENQAVALFTFDPDQPGDLGFKKGDIITAIKKTDKAEDWWTGRIGTRQGIFPSNYVCPGLPVAGKTSRFSTPSQLSLAPSAAATYSPPLQGSMDGDRNDLVLQGRTSTKIQHFSSHMYPQTSQTMPDMPQFFGGVVSRPLFDSAEVSSTPHSNAAVAEQEFDLQSIASLNTFHDSALGSSNPSAGSISSIQDLPQSAQQEVLLVLISDKNLRPLIDEAARKTDSDRFTRNIRRALMQYGADLSKSATEAGEKAAAVILRRHSQWIASSLYDVTNPNRDTSNQRMKDLLKQDVDRRSVLERYLAEKSLHHAPPRIDTTHSKIDEDDESISDMSDEDIEDDPKFPNLDHLKRFLTAGQAFENLKWKISDFICPERPPIPRKESLENRHTGPTDKVPELPANATYEELNGDFGMEGVEFNTKQECPAAAEQSPGSPGSGSSQRSHNMSLARNRGRHGPNPLNTGSQGQDHTTLESSYQASTSTEQTDVSLMDYDVDYSDDDLGYPSMDGSEYADAKTEERISNPRTYFKKLEEFEREIYETSSVWICKRNPAGKIHSSPANSRCRVLPLDGKDNDLQRSIESLNEKLQSPLLLCLLECHNMVQRSYHNIQKMQEAGFCGGHISVLVQKSDRTGVANLFRIDAIKIMRLYKNLAATLKVLGLTGPHIVDKFVSNKNSLGTFLTDYAEDINLSCEDILNGIGLRRASNSTSIELWQRTAHVVDFAILSYVGAHIERFDIKFLDMDISCFRFSDSGPSLYDEQAKADLSLREVQDAALSYDDATKLQCNSYWPLYTLRRRRLQCLDNLLGGMEVWVFHQSQNDVQDDTRLCLSTDMETLTDIWGPSWKIMRKSSPSQIERLDIGNGSIVPWASHPNLLSPDIRLGEVYCHWIPVNRWNSMDIEDHQKGLERKYFLDTDKLLIGAKEYGLLLNRECNLTVACLRDIKSKLHDESALQRPGTDRPRRYADSYALQVQGSVFSAVSGAAMVTYKRRNGQNMKDALVERWRNTKNRNPGELEAFYGVEVSLCTQNARRRRLLELLNSTTMRKYLKGIHFEWISDECEIAYFDSLSSRGTFRKFWNQRRDWRQSAGEAISLCLDRLELTGIDEDNGQLSAFWADTFDEDEYSPTEEWLVKLVKMDHTWTRFLRDSPEVLTMAVIDSRCLDFNDLMGYGRRCRQLPPTPNGKAKILELGFPVLETAILVNEKAARGLIQDGKLEKVETNKPGIYAWCTENLSKKTEFSLGNQGKLVVYEPSNCYCPPIMSWHPVKCEKLQEFKNVGVRENMMGEYEEKHHHEYISGSWSCKPFRILVLSKSTGKEKE